MSIQFLFILSLLNLWSLIICIVINLSGDDYDASGVSSFDKKRLDDIKDWQSGNKTIAEEAIDKVKEFVSSIRIFDNPDDFGWAWTMILCDLYDDDLCTIDF